MKTQENTLTASRAAKNSAHGSPFPRPSHRPNLKETAPGEISYHVVWTTFNVGRKIPIKLTPLAYAD